MRRFVRSIRPALLTSLLTVGALLILPGCERDSDLEDAAEEAGDALEEGAENVDKAIEDAKKK